jgi:hypothetical protein
LFIELVVASPPGEMKVLTAPDLPPLKPGGKYELQAQLDATLSKESMITLFASPEKFSPGEVIRFKPNEKLKESVTTHFVGDRIYHRSFEDIKRPAVVVKKTLEIETR